MFYSKRTDISSLTKIENSDDSDQVEALKSQLANKIHVHVFFF